MKRIVRCFKYKISLTSIGQRIVAVMMLIMILTVSIFIYSTYVIMRHQLLSKTEVNTKKDLTIISEKLDMLIERVNSDSIIFLASEACQSLLRQADDFLEAGAVEKYKMYKLMNETMRSFFNTGSIYRSIIFYDLNGNAYAADNMIVGSERIDTQKEKIVQFIVSTSNEEWLTIHESPWKFHTSDEDTYCIGYLHKVYDKNSGKLIGIMELEMDCDVILSLYTTITREGSNIYLVDSDDVVVSSNLDDEMKVSLKGYEWFQYFDNEQDSGTLYMNHKEDYIYFIKEYTPLSWQIISAIPMEDYKSDFRIFSYVDIFIGFILIIAVSFVSMGLILSITKPLRVITSTIQEIGRGNYDKRIKNRYGGEIGTLAFEFNKMIDKTKLLMVQMIETEQNKREFELSLIQMQMTPHFFYNILESICGLIVIDDKKKAIQTIHLLSSFYRGVLNKGRDIIPISEELKIAKNYLDIMQICYPNTFSYTISCEPEAVGADINKLTLQPILENAVRHGVIGMGQQGVIEITVTCDDLGVVFCISDNGNGMSQSKLDSLKTDKEHRSQADSFGIRNTDERIKLYFGEDYGVSIISHEGQGTWVTIRLPKSGGEK